MTTEALEFTGQEVTSIIAALQRSIDRENELIAKSDNNRFVTEGLERTSCATS
jgi:hypothetical protein